MPPDFVPPQNYYRVSVKALIFDNQRRVLVFKDHAGEYEMPGGGLDHGESYEAGIRRELREEVGVEAAQVGPELFSYPCHTLHGRPKICLVFPVWLNAQHFKPSDEVAEARFVTREEFERLPFQRGEAEVTAYADKIWPGSRYPSPFYRVALRGIIRDEQDRVLVVENKGHLFELPGGGWEHDETEEACLRRELSEELGVEIKYIGDIQFVYKAWSEERAFWMLRLNYAVTLKNHKFTPGDVMIAARFVTRDEFLQLAWCSEDKPLLELVDKIWPQ
ncbi:MAG TPA: NUDIX hydrolase [Bacillota bacterium]|nr:NUDIX hydrolase [Bacillota bacterium]